jgi:hypothetical protein
VTSRVVIAGSLIRGGRVVGEHPREVVDVRGVAVEIVQCGAHAVGCRSVDEVVVLVGEHAHDVVVANRAKRRLVAEMVHDQGRAHAGIRGDHAHAHGVETAAREGGDRRISDAGASGEIIGY